MKPTCLIAGMFNYDTIVSKEGRKGPEQVIAHEVGGTGGVVSKLMAALGWKAMPVGRFDDTEEGVLLRDGLAAYGCDTRYVTNLPDGQRYASRNCSYFTTCCDELLDELGVRNIVEKPM